jgi:hypothetical protein
MLLVIVNSTNLAIRVRNEILPNFIHIVEHILTSKKSTVPLDIKPLTGRYLKQKYNFRVEKDIAPTHALFIEFISYQGDSRRLLIVQDASPSIIDAINLVIQETIDFYALLFVTDAKIDDNFVEKATSNTTQMLEYNVDYFIENPKRTITIKIPDSEKKL